MSPTKQAVDRLKYLLQDEMSAVETYTRAISHLHSGTTQTALTDLKAIHAVRLEKLLAAVKEAGGEAPQDSGLWGKFASLVERGAEVLGDKAIVSALEEHEVKSLADYKSDLEVFEGSEHKMLIGELLPSQQEVYETILKLHKSLK